MNSTNWLLELDVPTAAPVEGLIPVAVFDHSGRAPEQVAMLEKAASYGAHAVFFEAGRNGRPAVAQAFVFVSDGPAEDPQFARTHQRLWSWGGVPLVYRKTPGLVQLFRCAHNPDFASSGGGQEPVCKPYKILRAGSAISSDPWWDASRLRNGTLWDDRGVCKAMLSASGAAHKRLIDAVKDLNKELNDEGILPRRLRRKLLILSLLIAYLEERKALPQDFFGQFKLGATRFFDVLAHGDALVDLLAALEDRFNGNVFALEPSDRQALRGNGQLSRFARLIQGRQELNGQLTLWQLYSFKDLPVELISHIYQLFVSDADSSVYTPPFLVRLMLDEALSWERLDRLQQSDEIILDPSCGSGVFLVEAYKRLVLHWRSRNKWKRPSKQVLTKLLQKVHGIDCEEGAVELAAFSLCLALCDALEPETIRASIKLFPPLAGATLHHSCFFEAKERGLLKQPVGVVIGNPPFSSSLKTPGAERSYIRYQQEQGSLPDKQLAYLFLHESMEMVARGGVLSMLQQYNLLYNQQSLVFRQAFISKWDVREILDFVSVRGLFQKGKADTKVIVVLAEANTPPSDRRILHATFRRSGRIAAQQGFDIDYYDLHWLRRELVLRNDRVWRTDLLGGGRVLGLIDRLASYPTLKEYATARGWDSGEGFIGGQSGVDMPAAHIVGKPVLPSEALTLQGLDVSQIDIAPDQAFERPRSEARFTPPMLLIREQMDLPHAVWSKNYLTYGHQIIGFAAPTKDLGLLLDIDQWLTKESTALRAFVAAASVKLFTQKATTLSSADVFGLPYVEASSLDLSENEKLIADDIVHYLRDLVRLGEDSAAMNVATGTALADFSRIFTKQVNAIYRLRPLRALNAFTWPGIACQPFAFGSGEVDWSNADELQHRLGRLLKDKHHTTLQITRITRVYDERFVFLLKPDRLRYWLGSIALRDADEMLADLRAQGF
jgi:N-6 DNA Methylase